MRASASRRRLPPQQPNDERLQIFALRCSEGIASIKLDRPVNAIHEAMTDEYFDALDHADRDDAVKVIVLSGEGKGLSAGADLKYLAGFGTDEMARFLEKFYIEQVEKVRGLRNRSSPRCMDTRGKVPTMAFTCDMVVASDDSSFGYPGCPTQHHPVCMSGTYRNSSGRMRAAELILTGDPIDAAEAGRLGLVTKVVPRAELRAKPELAKRLAHVTSR